MPETPSPTDLRRVLETARQARGMAYAPYSGFTVGSALLTGDGQIHSGCNVEIGSWEEATCAERVAILDAITAGAANERLDFIRLIVISTQEARPGVPLHFNSPCGNCRQLIYDFADAHSCQVVIDDGKDGQLFTLDALLPLGYRLGNKLENPVLANCSQLEQQALDKPDATGLLGVAQAIRANASRRVQDRPEGAAILTTDGRAFCGTSAESSCTALSLRALRCAVDRAVVSGTARHGAAFVKSAALALPRSGRTPENIWRQAINPALVAEFFAPDADIFLQMDGAAAISLKAAEMFACIDSYAAEAEKPKS